MKKERKKLKINNEIIGNDETIFNSPTFDENNDKISGFLYSDRKLLKS